MLGGRAGWAGEAAGVGDAQAAACNERGREQHEHERRPGRTRYHLTSGRFSRADEAAVGPDRRPRRRRLFHFHSSTISGSALRMMSRTFASVFPRPVSKVP
jgi:hypothetical protein